VDMDAYYASVEQRDDSKLRGKPICVGGRPNGRGVVQTCSYEARKFGVHSAMPASHAKRLCPEAIFVRPRFDVYKEVSLQIREVFHEYTDLVEPLSLDEAFMDVSERVEPATLIAREILKKIKERTQLTASAGVSYNKFMAKIASDYNKPAGITVISPEGAQDFIDDLPIGKFYGIGRVTEKRLVDLGIYTGLDLKRLNEEELVKILGKAGHFYYHMARGMDHRPVRIHRGRKSLGHERTFAKDMDDTDEMLEILNGLAGMVEKGLRKTGKKGKTVTLKVKYSDFTLVSRAATAPDHIWDAKTIMELITPLLLENTEAGERPVRLLGISMSNLIDVEDNYIQTKLIGSEEIE